MSKNVTNATANIPNAINMMVQTECHLTENMQVKEYSTPENETI